MTEGQQAQSKTQKVSDVICTYRPTKVSAEKKKSLICLVRLQI